MLLDHLFEITYFQRSYFIFLKPGVLRFYNIADCFLQQQPKAIQHPEVQVLLKMVGRSWNKHFHVLRVFLCGKMSHKLTLLVVLALLFQMESTFRC